jgi:hypothetical protein
MKNLGGPRTNLYCVITRKSKFKYQVFQRFHNFIIVDKIPCRVSKAGIIYTMLQCKCDCGILFFATPKQIGKGRKSCGCLSKARQFQKADPTNG